MIHRSALTTRGRRLVALRERGAPVLVCAADSDELAAELRWGYSGAE